MAPPPEPTGFGEYLKRLGHVIALQGIFGILLLSLLFIPDDSLSFLYQGQVVLTLLQLNSLAIFALFLVLTIAIFRQEADGSLGEGDPFRRVAEGYGRPAGSTTLFRVVHAIFSIGTILIYLTAPPPGSTLLPEIGVVVLFAIIILSAPGVTSATARFADRAAGGFGRAFACLIYLLGLCLIFAGAVTGIQNLLIAGMVVISFEVLYVVIREDRRIRAGESSREG